MSDSIDRVFAHALNTVKKIPRTGSARPPLDARMKLYGLYKQSMEGDVEGVMERPEGDDAEEAKWDAWAAQKGLSRTEAKRRYIQTLIDTMHGYASTTDEARELVEELEFVWDQIKSNPPSSSGSGQQPGGVGSHQDMPGSYYQLGESSREGESGLREGRDDGGGGEGGGGVGESGLRQLSPVSQEGEEEELEEEADVQLLGREEPETQDERDEFVDASQYADEVEAQVFLHPAAAYPGGPSARPQVSVPSKEMQQDQRRWRHRIEAALVKMTAEVAALREQLEAQAYNVTGSAVRRKRSRLFAWCAWLFTNTVKLAIADLLLFAVVLLWLRRRGDLWLEKIIVGWLSRAKRRVRGLEAGRVVGEQIGRMGLRMPARTALGFGGGRPG